jgi:hypothetical protein
MVDSMTLENTWLIEFFSLATNAKGESLLECLVIKLKKLIILGKMYPKVRLPYLLS